MSQSLDATRLRAARHLLRPRQIRDSMALSRQPSFRNAALAGFQAALTLAIALPLIQLSPFAHLTGFASLGALVALFGRFAPRGRRVRIVLYCGIVQLGAVLAMSLAAQAGLAQPVQLLLLALLAGLFFLIAVSGQFGPPGVLIFVFAGSASMAQPGSGIEILGRLAATGGAALLALAVCAATEALRHAAGPDRPLPTDPWRPMRERLAASARIVLVTALPAIAADALGAGHPAWAAMGAIAVLSGQHLQLSLHRSMQRMAGTALGALLVWVILGTDPSVWGVIGILVLLQFTTELIIGSNYGLGQILVTPMALLMSHLAAPHSSGVDMASERVLDTLLGVTLGMAVAIVFSSVEDRVRLVAKPR